MGILEKGKIIDEDYGFLDYEFKYYGNGDPLLYLIIEEQFDTIRDAFYDLGSNTRHLLQYFILNDSRLQGFDIDIDLRKHLNNLRKKFLDLYNNLL